MRYTELQVTTNFTFLRGGSHPEELVEYAATLGYTAIGVTDRNTLAGIVRAHAAAKGKNIRLIPACRLDLLDGPSLLAYPTSMAAYSRLSGLLTEGNLRTEKGKCALYKADVYRYKTGIKFMVIPPAELNGHFDFDESFKTELSVYRKEFGNALYLAASFSYQGNDAKKLFRLNQLSKEYNIPLVATNDVHYHEAERRQLQDVLTCVREKCTIQTAGYRLLQNAERFLKPEKEMLRLFRHYPDALARTQEIVAACTFSLDELKYIYPEEITSEGRTPQQELEFLTWKGAKERFGEIPDKIKNTIEKELEFMERKNYASYFLTVYDFVQFARNRGILCQGRGSAANSVVCYSLGITSVNPTKINLLFARFMSDARDEPPDIDVDFEHERREEVMQYIYEKYGRHRAGIVATVTQVHWKGAVRDVGKAMGLSMDAVDHLAKSGYEFTPDWFEGKTVSSGGFTVKDTHLLKVLQLTNEYIGFPRQLGQHTGGFVITQGRLSDLCPILNARMEDRTNIEWNKDDIETLGFLKVDVLALGMLTCIRKAFDLVKQHYGEQLTLENVLQREEEGDEVYQMISRADTIGVFQIESRAQMTMLPRLKPQNFYDLVIEVAIVRPGPIQGDMVHPYLRRREGKEPEIYPKEELREILGRTRGVPLFQEQAMEIAIVAAEFTPAEADGLRRSMATFKSHGQVAKWQEKLVGGMVKRGYEKEFAERVFKQLEGFGSYGFPESHAASFALLVYVSAWIKYHYPDVFCTALLNSMPMGFYQPAQLVIDAQKHGVNVLPVDVNLSLWDNTLEKKMAGYCPVRLGFRQVKGLREEEIAILLGARVQPFTTIHQLHDAGMPLAALERLADADAFRSLGLDRRRALWEVTALSDKPTGVFKGQLSESAKEGVIALPSLTMAEHVLQDYATTTLSLKAHPVSFARPQLLKKHFAQNKQLEEWPDGTYVKVSGLVLVRQRPGTATGVCFITMEDETGVANLVVFQKVFNDYRKEIQQSRLLGVSGKLQREGNVVHVVVRKVFNLNALLEEAAVPDQETIPLKTNPLIFGNDERYDKDTIVSKSSKAIQGSLFPSRDFK